jgi:methyltransferase
MGGVEVGARHYPLFILLHAGFIAAMPLAIPWDAPANLPLVGVFLALQAARVWVIGSLGPYWTTRIITVPGAPLVRKGPFRYVRHPNYLIVTGEIAVLPLAFGAWEIAAIFSLLNLALLLHRVRVEERALKDRA